MPGPLDLAHAHTHTKFIGKMTVPVLKFMEELTGKSTISVKALKLVSFPKVAWGREEKKFPQRYNK